MKKIVHENLHEFAAAKGGHKHIISENKAHFVNEGMFGNALNWIKDAVVKAGNILGGIVKGVMNALAPGSIGLLLKGNKLNKKAIGYVASQADVQAAPDLGGFTQSNLLAKRGPDVPYNYDGLSLYPYDVHSDPGELKESLNEAKIKMPIDPETKIPDIDVNFLKRQIKIAIIENKKGNLKYPPLVIWGAPGIGKTQIVKQVTESMPNGGRVIDVITSLMSPEDWLLPTIDTVNIQKDVEREKSGESTAMIANKNPNALSSTDRLRALDTNLKYVELPKSWLPVYKPTGDPQEDKLRNDIVNFGDGGVLFLDEISRASKSVQNTLLTLIESRTLGEYRLGDKWVIICASNRKDDDDETQEDLGNAFTNRLNHYNFVLEFKDWQKWAMETGRINKDILEFLEFSHSDFFYALDTELGKNIPAPSPRTWEKASWNLSAYVEFVNTDPDEAHRRTARNGEKVLRAEEVINIISSAVGMEAAQEIAKFLLLKQDWSTDDIKEILTNPKKARLPKKDASAYSPAVIHALMSLIVTWTKGEYNEENQIPPETVANFSTYLTRLDNGSLGSVGIKKLFKAHPYMHDELGQRENDQGQLMDKYKEALDIFIEKYREIF